MAQIEPKIWTSHLTIAPRKNGSGSRAVRRALHLLRDSREDAEAGPSSKRILKDVTLDLSGPGLTAIIGHSGSGKTTLLDALRGRSNLAGLKTDGITNVAGYNVSDSRSSHANGIAYVEQRDHLLPLLTVEETLQYAAALRLPHKSGEEQKAEVDRVLQLLHLNWCRTTRIGNENTGGCSGGERRRVSIGVQLLHDVPILFLDEPTTGLDAKAALGVVKALRNMAEAGMAVVMTVHQPRSEVWSLVDRCVIMSVGAVLYSGTTAKCLAHLDAIGCPAPEHENPFDFIMDTLAAGKFRPSVKANPLSVPEDHSSLTKHVQGLVRPQECAPTAKSKSKAWLHAFSRLRTHCGRAWKVTTRDHLGVLAGLVEAVLMGLACGLIFLHLGGDEAGIRSRQGALYVACTVQPYITSVREAYRLCDNIDFYERERRDSVIGPWTYYASRRMVRLALEDVLVPLIFVAVFYPLSGLEKGVDHLLVFFAIQFLLHLASVNLATICTSIVRDFLTASLVANLILVTNFLTAGFLINTQHLPVWLKWTKWVSFVHYAFSALASNEFAGKVYDCPIYSQNSSGCNDYDGNHILASLGVLPSWLASPLMALFGFVVLLSCLAIASLHLKRRIITVKIHDQQDVSASACGTAMAIAPESIASATRPMEVCVHNLSLSTRGGSYLERWSSRSRSRSSPKQILSNLCFAFEAGGMHAIMGSSGSGKSTLLNAIAGRSKKTLQTGHVILNGHVATPRQLRSNISVVPQDDICSLPFLTVRETLHAAAVLRLPPELTRSQKLARADEVLHKLGLDACANTIIGATLARGISGGEKRRVSIAVQILTDSTVLLLDEPTSGLDGATAADILQCLASLAQAGRTVIMVIHQPRWEFLSLFKSILILSQNGLQAFIGSANDLLARLSDGKELPPCINPADFALDILADIQELPAGKIDEQDKEYKDYMDSRQTSFASISDTVSLMTIHRTIEFRNALPVLLWRTMLNYRRSPSIVVERVMQITGLGILLLIFFTPIGADYWSIQSRMGIFCQASALYFVGMLDAVAMYPVERRLFRQELIDGASSTEVFVAQYTIIGAIIQVTGSLLYSALLLITGLPRTAEFFFATAYTTLAVVSCGESIGLIFLSYINHDGLAIAIMAALLCLSMALCGTLSINLPSWINALNHINPAKWQVQISASISMRDEIFECAAEAAGMGSCTAFPGRDILDLYGLNKSSATSCGILLGLVIGYRIVAYTVVKWRIRQ